VRCDSRAPKIVRHALERFPEVGSEQHDALLVASELVTNAVRHSRASEETLLRVCARRERDLMHICVVDPGLSGLTAKVSNRPPGLGGLGLKVVQALSERWGSERRPDGYRVWADVPLG